MNIEKDNAKRLHDLLVDTQAPCAKYQNTIHLMTHQHRD